MKEGASIYQERKEDLSFYHWLKDQFSSAPFVNIVDAFPTDHDNLMLTLPTISIEWEEIVGVEYELGNRQVLKHREWYVDIFAVNKSQRDEFSYKIFNDLINGIPVYDYDEGFPEQGASPTQIGKLLVEEKRIKNLHVDVEDPENLYYRAVVIFTAVYESL